jgi:large subunit ribosomal protein L10
MPTPKKATVIDEISEKLSRAKALVVTDYRGLTVAQLQELRTKLRGSQVDYVVVKNTLARRAADANGLEDLKAELVGPAALAIGYDDPLAPARLINEYVRQTRRLVIKSGLLGKTVVDADGVRRLADLPSREALLGQLAGTLNHSVAQLAGSLQGAVSKLASGLEAYRRKLEGAGA